MSSFIPDLHKDLRSALSGRRGATRHANDVPCGAHKEYPRMERIPLSNTAIATSLSDAFRARQSFADPKDAPALSLDELGALLGGLRRHENSLRRMYPSGGALYPIETYIVNTEMEDGKSGVFHYHPTAHALERLWDAPPGLAMSSLVLKPGAPQASSIAFFTALWERSSAKYGDFAYMLSLLEAGHMSENVLLAAAALGIHARPVMGFRDEIVLSLLDIDERLEQPVLSIILCKGTGDIEKTEAE